MKGAILALSFLILAATSPIHSEATAVPGEDLFKWGEYDSLIRLLELAGTRARPASSADSADLAKSYLFLGVAFFATGKAARADSTFEEACNLDPQVKLERFYVTQEIADRFQSISLDAARRRQALSARKAVAALSGHAPAAGGHAGGTEAAGGPTRVRRKDKEWLWWGLGATAVAAAGGALVLMNRDEPPDDNITTIDARPK